MTGSRADVVVIGDALLDVTARPMSPIRSGADVPAEVRISFGGQGANLAIRLARQGVGVELICGLGDDPAAGLLADALRADGVRLRPVAVPATGTVVILLDAAGERTMLSDRAPFSASVDVANIPDAAWIVTSGYLFLEPDAAAFARATAGLDSRRAVVGCAVPADELPSWRSAVAAARSDLLVLNEDEASALEHAADMAGGLVVTARDGVTATIGEIRASTRVEARSGALDTTGAGDAFVAGLLARLLDGTWPPSSEVLRRALTDAAGLANQVVQASGAQAIVAGELRA